MILSSKSSPSSAVNTHGCTKGTRQPWSSWITCSAPRIGSRCFQIVYYKMHRRRCLTIALCCSVYGIIFFTGKRRFHFESFWLKMDGFLETSRVLAKMVARPCLIETLCVKFKSLTRALQSWGEKKVGHIRSQLQLAKEIIHQLEIAQD